MKILIIDDNPLHAELAARRLEEENWEVETTDEPDLSSALEAYDVILLDYSMPKRSGLEVLRRIKDLQLPIPVIMLTGHGNESIATEAIKLGAYDYVVKDTRLLYLDRLAQVLREAKNKHELIETNRFLIQELRRANEKLQTLSMTDELTGLYNYRFMHKQIQTEMDRSLRYQKPFSLCIIDVDYFKRINDEWGHPTGDLVLKEIALLLGRSTRSVDFAGRYGGDEFIVIFPDTHLEAAAKLCDRIRKSVAEKIFKHKGKAIRTTLSLGATEFNAKSKKTVDQLIASADKCLYQAKKMGRNQLCATARLLGRSTSKLGHSKTERASEHTSSPSL